MARELSDEPRQQWPWDKHETTPEAEALLRRARVQNTLDRLERERPMRFRDYLVLGIAASSIITIPLIILSFFVDFGDILGRL